MRTPLMRSGRWIGLALAVALLGGCGPTDPQAAEDATTTSGTETSTGSSTDPDPGSATDPGSPAGDPSTGGTDMPVLPPPSGAPQTPTDQLSNSVLTGTIRVDQGSCYTLETDDGKEYALVGGAGGSIGVGAVVRVKIDPGQSATATCRGTPVKIVELTVL